MHYSEIGVILRFVTEQPLSPEDVRAFLQQQGDLTVAEVCYGELHETPEAPWTGQWKQRQATSQLLERVGHSIYGG